MPEKLAQNPAENQAQIWELLLSECPTISAIGDTISCDAPYSAIGFRGTLFLRCPPSKAWLWIVIGHFLLRKGVGV